MYLKNRIGPSIWLRQTSYPINRKMCKLKWFQLREKCIMSCYSQLSPRGHLSVMDTPIIRTPAESLAKNYRHFDWNKPPTLQTYRHLSWSRHEYQSAPFDILAELSQFIIYFFLFLSSSLSLWLKSEHSDSLLTWSFCETTGLLQGSTLQPVGSLMWPAFTQWRLNFQAWSPTWPPRYVTFFFGKMYTNDNLLSFTKLTDS